MECCISWCELNKKMISTRLVTKQECHWLDDDIPEGTVLFLCTLPTYGCIDTRTGVAVTLVENEYPFFQFPIDALKADVNTKYQHAFCSRCNGKKWPHMIERGTEIIGLCGEKDILGTNALPKCPACILLLDAGNSCEHWSERFE